MRSLAGFLAGFAILICSAAQAAPQPNPFSSLNTTVDWINNYRIERPVNFAPVAIRALSLNGGFKDPESSGVYVGFIAGLIAANPDRADALIDAMFPMREEDHWAIVRGIAYSGHPRWRFLLKRAAERMPTRAAMIAQYMDGRLPTLDALVIKPSPTSFQRLREALFGGDKPKKPQLEPTQTLLDTLWGYYLASGSYEPVMTIVAMLPWANDRDDVEKLTIGSMAKYTLAVNASRDPTLLGALKYVRNGKYQSKDVTPALDEVIAAAETADAGKLRKDALAAIEQLKTKGPNYKKELSTWGKVGQGAIAVGCVAAAATGHVEFGLPCVFGGAGASAVAYYANEK
ncbi:MAG: hypothetical protein JO254_02475 [Pseudolabrys sp.]|nr:hypothetical protein [Pseudolabrys sp.]